MLKKWWWIGAIALVAGVLVVGALLVDRRDTHVGSQGASLNQASSSGTGEAGSAGTAASASSVSKAASQGAASTAKAASQAAASTAKAAPKPQLSKKAALKPVTQPPEKTVAFIDAKRFTGGSKYDIAFVPYGVGPGGPQSGLVIKIDSSKPQGSVAKPFDFKGFNAIVDTSKLPADQAVKMGGTYEGTLVLAEQGGVLSPQLVSVKVK